MMINFDNRNSLLIILGTVVTGANFFNFTIIPFVVGLLWRLFCTGLDLNIFFMFSIYFMILPST